MRKWLEALGILKPERVVYPSRPFTYTYQIWADEILMHYKSNLITAALVAHDE